MAVEETIARALAELHAGDPVSARRRLQGLLSGHPTRLDVRAALAATYRAQGDAVQAGRWSYLDHRASRTEVTAFEAAYPDPVARLRSLGWSGPAEAAGPVGAERLTELQRAARLASGDDVDLSGRRSPARRPRDAEDPWSVDRGCFLWTAVLCAAVTAACSGAVAMARRR